MSKEYRINGFEQIKAFYSWVFNNPEKARPTHVSLYLFLVNQANRANWAEWVKCPYDLAMQGACIGNNGTYYKCLDELQTWGLIKYQKGVNNYKAPLINLIRLYKSEQLTEQVTVPLSEQVTGQQTVQLTEQVTVHIYKLLTDNIKRITENIEDVIQFLDDKDSGVRRRKPFKPPTIEDVRKFFADNGYDPDYGETRYHYYNDANWFDAHGNPVLNWKQKMRNVWFKDEHKKQGLKLAI